MDLYNKRGHMLPRLATLAIASAVVTLATSTGAAAHASSQHVKVISSCTKATYQPSGYIFFCGDADAGLHHATYDWWTDKTAHGTGTYYFNDCKPNCASGHEHQQKAEFTLYRVRDTTKFGPLFTRAEVDTPRKHAVFEMPTRTI
jgi:hypothetical protein